MFESLYALVYMLCMDVVFAQPLKIYNQPLNLNMYMR